MRAGGLEGSTGRVPPQTVRKETGFGRNQATGHKACISIKRPQPQVWCVLSFRESLPTGASWRRGPLGGLRGRGGEDSWQKCVPTSGQEYPRFPSLSCITHILIEQLFCATGTPWGNRTMSSSRREMGRKLVWPRPGAGGGLRGRASLCRLHVAWCWKDREPHVLTDLL